MSAIFFFYIDKLSQFPFNFFLPTNAVTCIGLYFINLMQTKVIWEQGNLTNAFPHQINYKHVCGDILLISNWCGRAPVVVDGITHRQGLQGSIRKQAKKASKQLSTLVSASVPASGFLLCFSFCLGFPQWWIVMRICQQNICCLLSMFYYNNRC